jgi:hypothetical protein
MLKTIVITSCTGEKKFHPENQLVQDDFLDGKALRVREKKLAEFLLPAGEMYTGMQHLRLMEGVAALRGAGIPVDVAIVSAGYGLIPESRKIAPYEVTFNTMKGPEVDEWAIRLGIHDDLVRTLEGYDLVFVLLGDKYLRAAALRDYRPRPGQTLLFFASGMSRKALPHGDGIVSIELGNADARSFGYGLVGLKGYLFKKLAETAAHDAALLDRLHDDPKALFVTLDTFRRPAVAPDSAQPLLFKLPEPVSLPKKKTAKRPAPEIIIPHSEWAANYSPHMKYFIPEWDDLVDPNYDFLTDTPTPDHDAYRDDVYAHEIYPTPNYDGILVSKVIVEKNKHKKAIMGQKGVHQFLRFDPQRPIMGDCGAFDYVDEPEPPFTTSEILDYYQSFGFNIGVSIDHLIVGKYAADPDERQRRYDLTRRNAADFLAKHKAGGYTFLPSGIAQGWDPKSYRDAVAELIEMGYRHISIGGLVRTRTPDIIEILKTIRPLVPDYLQIHLFGIARPDALKPFRELGVSAMDSSRHLRRAWLGDGDNHYGINGKKYAAFRIPPVEGHGVRVKKIVAEGRATLEECAQLEKDALDALRQFDKGRLPIPDTLHALFAYDEVLGDNREGHRECYEELLTDKPWQQCPCPVCRSLGIDVIIFRGNNRNRRRGFHNTFVFYRDLKKLYPDE